MGELNVTQTELTGLEESLKNIGDKVDRAEIRSPPLMASSTISPSRLWAAIVEPAQRLAEIVPAGDDLKITARVTPNDIAFLKLGRKPASVFRRMTLSRYGYPERRADHIGANSIRAEENKVYFEIEVRTTQNYLGTAENPLPITPGHDRRCRPHHG